MSDTMITEQTDNNGDINETIDKKHYLIDNDNYQNIRRLQHDIGDIIGFEPWYKLLINTLIRTSDFEQAKNTLIEQLKK